MRYRTNHVLEYQLGVPACGCGSPPQLRRLTRSSVSVYCGTCKISVSSSSKTRARDKWVKEMKRRETTKICPGCEVKFSPLRGTTVYCTPRCRKEHYHKRTCTDLQIFKPYSLPPGTVGAIGELIVCSDLLLQGLEVFRAVSPLCSCDLIASNGLETNRVEVKTASMRLGGSYSVLRNGNYDTIAVVIGNRVAYEGKPLPKRIYKSDDVDQDLKNAPADLIGMVL
jgi:hypothetical protein